MHPIRRLFLQALPASWLRLAKRWYYPQVLKRFRPEQWPGAYIVERLLKPGDVVVDAGANVGYVSMLLARWVGRSGKVYSFEPVPETYALLSHNMRSLNLTQVVTHQVALSSRTGEGAMSVPQYPGGGENFYEARLEVAATPTSRKGIPVRRLDDLLAAEVRPIRFIKVDVEGHEGELAQGARQRLMNDHPALFVELSGPPCGEGPGSAFCRQIEDLGYLTCLLEGQRLRRVTPADHPVDVFFLTPEQLQQLQP